MSTVTKTIVKFTIQQKFHIHSKPNEDHWANYIPEHYYFNDAKAAETYLEKEIIKMKGDEFRIIEVHMSVIETPLKTFKY